MPTLAASLQGPCRPIPPLFSRREPSSPLSNLSPAESSRKRVREEREKCQENVFDDDNDDGGGGSNDGLIE